jgi:hypothetical protein
MDIYKVNGWKDSSGKRWWFVEERGIAVWWGTKQEAFQEAERLNKRSKR